MENHSQSFKIRDAVRSELPALARLHADTWNETYPSFRNPPTYALRESEWRQAFASDDPDWFCRVMEGPEGELVGFAKGVRYNEPEPPGFSGELNKLYLRRAYHGRGSGRRLLAHIAERFLAQGISSGTDELDLASARCVERKSAP